MLSERDTSRLELFSVVYNITMQLGICKGTMNIFRAAETLRQLARKYRGRPEIDQLFSMIRKE